MQTCHLWILSLVALTLPATAALATEAKISADACAQLRLKEAKVQQSGLLKDMSRGPEWAKANLSAARLLEIKNYITLDEKVKFGCRDAKVTPEAERASAAASRIELHPNADPTAPPVATNKPAKVPRVADPPKPAASPAKKNAKKRTRRRRKSSRHHARRSGKVTHETDDTSSGEEAPAASHLLGFETTVIRAPGN